MWSLMWRGKGWAVPVSVIVSLLVTQLVINYFFGPEFYQTNKWPKDVAIVVAMLLVGLVAYQYNFRTRTVHKDPVTEVVSKSPQHHFLFVPIQYWVLIVPLFFVWANEGAEKYRERDIAMITTPQVGDIYYVNMQEIQDGYTEVHKYGAMKVVSFDESGIQFVMSRKVYIKSRGPRLDYRGGEVKSDTYFDTQVVTYKKEQLISFRKESSVLSVVRPH